MAYDKAVRKARTTEGDSFYTNPNYDVVSHVGMVLADMENNNNKYYNVELHTDGDEYRIFSRYGRVGVGKGQTFVASYNTGGAARCDFEGIIREKERKGYERVDLVQTTVGSDQANKKVRVEGLGVQPTSVVPAKKSKLTRGMQEFIQKIYEEANQMVSVGVTGEIPKDGNRATPLGNIGVDGIYEGRNIVAAILTEILGGKDKRRIIQLNNEYYSKIPRKLPSNLRLEVENYKQDKATELITTRKRVQEEYEMLDVYESALKLASVMQADNLDAKYQALNSDIRHVTGRAKGDRELIQYINHKVKSTVDPRHGYGLEVVNVYQVRQKRAPQFDNRGKESTMLFHGTRSANMVGILSEYIKMPRDLGPGVHITGAMFGPGIYFAHNSTKSANYSFGSWAGTRNKYDTAYLLVAEVGLGDVYRTERAEYHIKAPKGYDSVMGVAGPSLRNHEFIVYNENQVRVRYIVEVKKVRK